jgi:CRISPR-associated protein Cas1
MIKRTLYFGNPAHLYMRNAQLCIADVRKNETEDIDKVISVPIEDIGVVVLDHAQITITQTLITRLLENNTALITCNEQHLPTGLMLPLSVNTTQTEKFKVQINATEPLKKQLWAQTVSAKLKNQAAVLQVTSAPATHQTKRQEVTDWLIKFSKEVKSGDTNYLEARGAAMYWPVVFSGIIEEPTFKREREGLPPNHLLNYGYSIVRAVVARQLVASGMLPTLGIFHRNKYNAYCLADDIMEPYRPYVDQLLVTLIQQGLPYQELTKEIKEKLLKLPDMDVVIDGENSKLMVAMQLTSSSLMKCFEGKAKKVIYPEL